MAKGKSPTGTVSKTADEVFERADYPSKYDDLIVKATRLRPGQSLKLPVKKGDDKIKMQARIKQALRRGLPEFEHKRYLVRRSEGNAVVIVCERRE